MGEILEGRVWLTVGRTSGAQNSPISKKELQRLNDL